ncbi:MAG: YraN family protein [Actinomycetaceae bacterium]|nr:YraN family protein [Actinomycetaceae bacterium]
MATKHRLGQVGEELATAFLEDQGWQIIDRNYRRKGIELDIVARDPERGIVFVEVKTRKSNSAGSAWESITASKAERLRRGAANWLVEAGSYQSVYLDAIVVEVNGGLAQIEHRRSLL